MSWRIRTVGVGQNEVDIGLQHRAGVDHPELRARGERAVVTSIDRATEALTGTAGTTITR